VKTKIAVISILLALVALFVFGCGKTSVSVLQETAILPQKLIDRTDQVLSLSKNLPLSKASLTANQLASAILTPEMTFLLESASMTGPADQFEIYLYFPLQGFPTDGYSYAVISNGYASGIAGVATDFYSYGTGGPSSPPYSHRGLNSYDIATLSLTLHVPAEANTLSFDWKFATEENPTFIGSFVDWARATITTSDGETNVLLLPDGKPVDVDNAIPFSNAVSGSSTDPLPPYPSPDDTVYNAVTGMYTSTFDITSFVGETITIDFQVGDENDAVLDSALFIDNLKMEISHEETLSTKAAGLAKKVVGADYQWGGKGWSIDYQAFLEPEQIKTEPYRYWKQGGEEYGKGLDCSGLSFWSYNKAYGAIKYLSTDNPVRYEGADGQYRYNFKESITEEDLKPGDLLFFGDDGWKDHVAMYVGSDGSSYDVVEAYNPGVGIIWSKKEDLMAQGNFVCFRRLTAPQVEMEFHTGSPIELIITDPEGFTITKDIYEIPGVFYYYVWDIDGDGELDDMVIVPEKKTGDYLITVVPKPDALPTDTYSLRVIANGETIVLAENFPISDIPDQPYIIRSTETTMIQIIPAVFDIDPDTLNLRSNIKWVTTYIELPECYNVTDINVSTVELWHEGNSVVAEWGDIQDGTSMVKFSGTDVMSLFSGPTKSAILKITGKIFYNGVYVDLEGTDTIRVIGKP
jgi:hypothetical protein